MTNLRKHCLIDSTDGKNENGCVSNEKTVWALICQSRSRETNPFFLFFLLIVCTAGICFKHLIADDIQQLLIWCMQTQTVVRLNVMNDVSNLEKWGENVLITHVCTGKKHIWCCSERIVKSWTIQQITISVG